MGRRQAPDCRDAGRAARRAAPGADGSSRFWTGWSPPAEGAGPACEACLRGWLETFGPCSP
ncbi:MAG: hypothetical protein CMH16_00100 [Methylobacterium sp.]|nr:hypothetical protein [Methylobacterium sp.]